MTPTRDELPEKKGTGPSSSSTSESDSESPGETPVQEVEDVTTPVAEVEGDARLISSIWMYSTSYASSDDSDSAEDDDVWGELQLLRQK